MQTRKSKKRDAIWSLLASTKEHPSAEWIHTRLKPDIPDLSLGTVYRNLSLFREEGRAISVATVGGQERFDACTATHAHFICRVCGEVADLSEIEVPELTLPGIQVEISQLNYYGICRSCDRSAKAQAKVKGETS